MTAVLKVLPHPQVDELVEHALTDHARFLAAAELATRPYRSPRRANHLARQAGAVAAEIAADIPALAKELAAEANEIESLHRHMAFAIGEECRQTRRADRGEADAAWFRDRTDVATACAALLIAELAKTRDELTRMRAENDQLRAAAPVVTP